MLRELRGISNGRENNSRKQGERKCVLGRGRSSHIAPESPPSSVFASVQQSQWANVPTELLLDIIRRVESSEISWPARRDVVACAAVCRSWREVTKEVVRTPEQCGLLTFPMSLKQVNSFICLSISVQHISFLANSKINYPIMFPGRQSATANKNSLIVLVFYTFFSLDQESIQSSALSEEKGELQHSSCILD